MKENNCLNCLYEPDWREPVGQSERSTGRCKWPFKSLLPTNVPAILFIEFRAIVKYRDGSGPPSNCKAHRPKEKSAEGKAKRLIDGG